MFAVADNRPRAPMIERQIDSSMPKPLGLVLLPAGQRALHLDPQSDRESRSPRCLPRQASCCKALAGPRPRGGETLGNPSATGPKWRPVAVVLYGRAKWPSQEDSIAPTIGEKNQD
jgi:hypothetical protein